MEMKQTTYETYPLNADQLNKGDTIGSERVSDFLGLPVNHILYKLKTLAVAKRISVILEDRGKAATVVVTRRNDPIGPGGIRVLTDEEAVIYNPRQYRHGLRRSTRAHKRLLQTDAAQLTQEGRRIFEREVVVQGAIAVSIASARAKAVLTTVKRNAPAMIEHKSE